MDNNNKIITEELKQIVVLMNYDRSKTLMEQNGSQVITYGAKILHFTKNNPDGFVNGTLEKWHDDNRRHDG